MSFALSGSTLAAFASAGATLYASNQAANAAEDAANLQSDAAKAGIAEQRRQFDAFQKLMAPFVQSGTQAISAQGNLIGLGGADAQRQAIEALRTGPQFQAMNEAGQNAILQNASATGGLRGGNTQAALAQFSPQLLSQLINQQYGQLSGLSQLGQAAAAGQASAGLNTGSNISNLLQQQGAAQAGGALAQGQAASGIGNAIGTGLGIFTGLGGKF